MLLPEFDYVAPKSVAEAVGLAAQQSAGAKYIAGGTGLVIELKKEKVHPQLVIDISKIAALREITSLADGISIGSCATFAEISSSRLILNEALALAQAAAAVGSPQIRNKGTVGGNIATASPAADTVTPLLALGAGVRLEGINGERLVPIGDLLRSMRKTGLMPGELITGIHIPRVQGHRNSVFNKLGRRNALAISRMNLAVVVVLDNDSFIQDAAVAVGAIAPNPVRINAVEALLLNRRFDELSNKQMLEMMQEEVRKIMGDRESAPYKIRAIGGMFQKSLQSINQNSNKER